MNEQVPMQYGMRYLERCSPQAMFKSVLKEGNFENHLLCRCAGTVCCIKCTSKHGRAITAPVAVDSLMIGTIRTTKYECDECGPCIVIDRVKSTG